MYVCIYMSPNEMKMGNRILHDIDAKDNHLHKIVIFVAFATRTSSIEDSEAHKHKS